MKKSLLIYLLLLLTLVLSAIPAGPNTITKTLSDGSTLDIRLRGDEHVHWVETTDGYTLIEENGIYYYAQKQGTD